MRLLAALALALATLGVCGEARAYTWMVRHGYTGCAPCHLDPSGGAVLTPYGRAAGALILTTRYLDSADEGEPEPIHNFLFGLVPLPAPIMLGGEARLLWFANKLEGVKTRSDWFLMQSDLEAGVSYEHVLAGASIGYAAQGAYAAALTNNDEHNLVSRHHWVGYELDAGTGLIVRAGRMNLPFGIRNIEHTLWARDKTRTNIESDQQHGIAVAWSPSGFRAELMGILGNYQIHPDAYRERGYSGYLEWLPTTRLGVGASSLVTHRNLDDTFFTESWRQAHGLFTRWATPWEPLVVLAEGDYVIRSAKGQFHRSGFAGYIQTDLEPLQGIHLVVTGEAQNVGPEKTPLSWGVWFSQLWFMAPHTDVRVDSIYQRLGDEFGYTDSLTLLLQAHLYL